VRVCRRVRRMLVEGGGAGMVGGGMVAVHGVIRRQAARARVPYGHL